MYKYEVRGFFIESNDKDHNRVDFMTVTPPCANEYQAKLYVTGKLKKHNIYITSIVRIIG